MRYPPRLRLIVVHRTTDTVRNRLDENFFRVRFARLTPRETQYLRAMAELGAGPFKSGEIASTLRAETRQLGPLRAGLIKKGMIYSPAFGMMAFTVPLFDEFIEACSANICSHALKN